jgi:hypothetical protein
MKSSASLLGVSLLLVLALNGPLRAGPAPQDFKSGMETAETENIPLDVLHARTSYVFGSDFRRGDGRFGSQDAASQIFSYQHRWLLDGPWYLRLGVSYERFDFGSSGAPVPNHLQGIAGLISLEYFEGAEVGFFIQSAPGVYFQNDVNGGAFDAPTVIALAYPVFGGDRFYLVGGVSMSLLRSVPVLPVLGALWHITPEWDLRAYLPEPRLVYKPSDTLQLWAGGALVGGSYKTDERNVHPGRLSGAVLTYYETRAGAGVTWKACPAATLEVGAGWAFQRNFNFHRAGEQYRLEGSPYVELKVQTQF